METTMTLSHLADLIIVISFFSTDYRDQLL